MGKRDGPAIGDALMGAVRALQTGARAERADMAYDMGVAEDKVDEPTFALYRCMYDVLMLHASGLYRIYPMS
jgi:hypothetical protein